MALYKDKEVEIISKAEALWRKVKESAEERLKMAQDSIIVETAVIKMAEKKIKNDNNKL